MLFDILVLSLHQLFELLDLILKLNDSIGTSGGSGEYGGYSKDKINTFVSVFPIDNPKFVLLVLLDEPKPSKEHIYYYRDGRAPYKGNWRNTAGWTTVLIAGNITEKIGPILATKY